MPGGPLANLKVAVLVVDSGGGQVGKCRAHRDHTLSLPAWVTSSPSFSASKLHDRLKRVTEASDFTISPPSKTSLRCQLDSSFQSLRILAHEVRFSAHSEMGGSHSQPEVPNPSIALAEERQRAEAAVEQARNDVEAAKALMAELIKSNQESQQKFMEAQQAAQHAAAAALERAHMETMAMVHAERAANEARLLAEAASRTANEEAKRRAAEAEEERKRTAAVQEQAKKDVQVAQEQATKLEEAANEEKKKAIAANASKKAAEEEVKVANAAKEEAERKLKEGIQPLVTPTVEEIRAAKRKVQYREDLFHFAVAGVAGGGKSSLINAFRGLLKKDIGAAATGVTETTLAMARYANPNAEYPYVWYDIPGAGTLKIPDWQYFNAQGLYVFDCIIILFDNRFTMTDIAILINCRRFKIPTYIVRSKADQHIRNIMKEMEYDSDDDEGGDQKKKLYKTACQQFIHQTRKSVKVNLEEANMPDQRVYIVSNETMLGVVKDKRPKKVIDEIELLNDLIGEAQIRRARRDAEFKAEVEKANAVKEDAQRKLNKGIQPVVTPTREEVRDTKRRAHYHEDCFHLAVAGVAGGGKSSLINAFRGLRNKDIGSAATGITETTTDITIYANPNADYPYVWYDIPGAGTLKIPDWQYFNNQGLYIFDCIIVMVDNRFTTADIAILINCRRFNIPAYIVRSKADQHIRNVMEDLPVGSDSEDEKLYQTARDKFIRETRRSVKVNLEDANIPDQKVYIISKETMVGVVKEKWPDEVIDEIDLLYDLVREAQARRGRRDVGAVTTAIKEMIQSLTSF
ncbi:interferon-inducible GTPase-domain-containing protein [Suillus clintonianus]|uniref:interferon-inducible GTPase-domain-containing protein n=1 Tax=Suillus clintonianus TaxID=1904413 RepID=UPI001B87A3B6|nr:interferon-inducible GTPase-domain-containing protein [Suillus clintonianus]KAG2145763.1 interferon-inducible GTPase-domain-containing protein [Suillus clintonianus]